MDWKLALPLHPEYRTPADGLVRPAAVTDSVGRRRRRPRQIMAAFCPPSKACAFPGSIAANLLSAGDTGPVLRALKRMMAMRHYKRSQTVEGVTDNSAIEEVGFKRGTGRGDVPLLSSLPLTTKIAS